MLIDLFARELRSQSVGASMRNMIIQYLSVVAVFLAIDAIWLSTAGRTLYVAEIGGLLRDRPDFVVAFAFYCLYAFGLWWFVVSPHLASATLAKTFVTGALFGLVAYATYDLTNLATMKGFTARIAVIDMAWGSLLSGSVSAASVWLLRIFKF